MGPKAYLADFTRKWCSGSTKSFDLLGLGSSPFFLRSWGDSNPHDTLYQSGPLIQARLRGLGLWGEPCKAEGEREMSNYKGEGEGQKVFSDEMHELVISESRVRGSNPQEKGGEEGCFNYERHGSNVGGGRKVGGPKEEGCGKGVY